MKMLQKPLKLKRVVAYCRISMITDRAELSYQAQMEYYKNYITQNPEWIFSGIYSDHGISGTSKDKRKGLLQMLEDARAGKIDLILTKSISRLARNTVDLLEITREMKSLGVEIFFEKENLSNLTADGELMLTLLASFAQAESDQRSRDVNWAVRRAFKAGIPHSFNLRGYSRKNGQIRIVEDEAKLVRRMYESYMKQISAETMAKEFAKEGLLWRDGTPISASSIRHILKNEKYKGCLLLQKHVTPSVGKHTILNAGHQEAFWVEDSHPAIVSKELWDAVQLERERRRKLGALANWSVNTSCFTSHLYCGVCKARFRKHTSKSSTGDPIIYWHCRKQEKQTKHARMIRDDELRSLSAAVLGLDVFDEEAFQRQVKSIRLDLNDLLTFQFVDGTERTIRRLVKPKKEERPKLSRKELSERASEHMKALWKDPAFRARLKEGQDKRWSDPKERERLSERNKKMWQDPSFRKKLSSKRKRRKKNG